MPLLGLRDVLSNPEDHQGGQNANEKDPALIARHLIGGKDSQKHADIHRRLEASRDPGTPALGPGLGEERRANRPLTPDSQRGDKAKDQKLPPGLSKRRKPGEERIGQDGQAQGAAPTQDIPQASKKRAAERPTTKNAA